MTTNTRTNGMTFTSQRSRANLEKVLQACKQGRTRQEVELILGMERRTALSYLIYLHDTKQIHIASWTREGIGQFYPIAVYKTGPGEDAPKLPELTEREKQQRAWAKLKADPVRYAKHRAKKARTNSRTTTWDDGVKRSTGNAFDWRGADSIAITSKDWRNSVTATANTAGTGTNPRKQFIINKGQ